ncbi:Na+/H+ antiporter NhaA [Sanguibacter inulinus]|uniref:Na(+)/H(+) antiporter NhaA n=1 Tax=Sanguibacter inulinus TaxID=60922 RepID=A0A853ET83_9MICO|nr:Na+/H+ antiporter NhaA [Sanguibacter inulinus]MBF0722634.1 Na+/H+ antiporter NhaA [Sanguibacter inulinus]NYS93779.1 Na+/H+ antiporter NhaA [Sanguibacter inulinus]
MSTPVSPGPTHEPDGVSGHEPLTRSPQDSAPPAAQTVPARLAGWVTRETTGGMLLIGAAILAIVWANSPWREIYTTLSETKIGPASLHLDLSVAGWAADGLLAIFFFVVGLELKHELVAGSLREPRQAAVPMLAAVGGMAVPAIFFVTVVLVTGDTTALGGWAIPTATDIAFALAVLAVFGRGLPTAVRTFLLTLAVVDDLLAIIVIAIFYTDSLSWGPLALAVLGLVLFRFLVRARTVRWWLLLPLAVVVWALVHASGIHATVAGVTMGFLVPALVVHGEKETRTHRFERTWNPLSSGIALPVFAFFAAGVTVVGSSLLDVLGQGVTIGIVVGLVVGKCLGILGTTWLVTRLTPLRLAQGIGIRDLLPVGLLAGIGFTVSLLIVELSFDPSSEHGTGAKIAVLLASVISATLGALALRHDARRTDRTNDMNLDGIPDDITDHIGDKKS